MMYEIDDMTAINELKKVIDRQQDTIRFQYEFMNDVLQYGRLRTLHNREGIKSQTFEMPYKIFAHYYGEAPPYDQPIEDWSKDLEKREVKMSDDPHYQQAEFMIARGYVPKNTDPNTLTMQLKAAEEANKKNPVTNTHESVYGENANMIEEMMSDLQPIEKRLIDEKDIAANKKELDSA